MMAARRRIDRRGFRTGREDCDQRKACICLTPPSQVTPDYAESFPAACPAGARPLSAFGIVLDSA
jgi:hypothetical protein